ncbi:LysM peptidoglycan-binding domain-containing protein [Brevibacillus borstelensis]|uniref:LysM peptidoglycan-binding domain-containing protein n=1 Tax=Brevibacillus borstelensis TaxID=45462 RepID=UPI001D0A067C|nr:LysM peptidoglycan-binding domain-containing protein [Brevibacillus borstelensis]MCC0564992.1 LysM peptidoglycan-binding domain-containing protein [Brevibacillus borstelensis]MCM3559046.1 LysM peptidoglycan-binding domain-containing protein [Brevibacillus borstelensis]MCM3622565.1 LysM peptidoglycan-binding domain-containing protein [Brevibacillus borstelensis]
MALQDGLLSFAIKETIFLSSDKAGIDEWRELELFPDVEVLETESAISITGCLQLFGKYKPIKDTSETAGGGTESLVEAVTFSPFRPGGSDGQLYGQEEQLHHRIPLNITIPLNRIAEIEDIYAVVDSFDYQLDSPHQVMIEADLKIAGIKFAETNYQTGQPAGNPEPVSYGEVPSSGEWQFAHASQDQSEELAQPISLEDIERKLAELESELHRQIPLEEAQQTHAVQQTHGVQQTHAMQQTPAAQQSPSGFAAMFEASQPKGTSNRTENESLGFGDVTEALTVKEQGKGSDRDSSPSIEQVSWNEPEANPALYEGMAPEKKFVSHVERQSEETASEPSLELRKVAESQAAQPVRFQPERKFGDIAPEPSLEVGKVAESQAAEPVHSRPEKQSEETLPAPPLELREVADSQSTETPRTQPEAVQEETVATGVSDESREEAQAEPATADADEAAVEAAAQETADEEAVEVIAQQPQEAVEEKEVRVAISGKPAREEGGKVNLTSIFSQATRVQQEAKMEEESSSQASRKGSFEADSASIETMHNLTSFVRSKEEKQSRLKLCIIQRDETLETICQRYAIPQSRILEVNNLRSDQIVAGQILYIPQ